MAEKWIMALESNCTDAAKEDEFNKWYDETHVPDVLQASGFVKATRYKGISPAEAQGRGMFLAIYEVEADDIDTAKKALDVEITKMKNSNRLTPLVQATSKRWFRQISSTSKKGVSRTKAR